MTNRYIYQVAGHVFEVTLPQGDPLTQQMSQYEPFRILGTEQKPVFS